LNSGISLVHASFTDNHNLQLEPQLYKMNVDYFFLLALSTANRDGVRNAGPAKPNVGGRLQLQSTSRWTKVNERGISNETTRVKERN
jgi:hypothetical protein